MNAPTPVLIPSISWEWHPGSFLGSAVVNDAKMDFLAKTLHIHDELLRVRLQVYLHQQNLPSHLEV